MTTRIAKRGAPAESPVRLLRRLHHHILCGVHTGESLARALGVSTATISRLLAALRRELAKEGRTLVSIKEGAVWRYEVRESEDDPWASDPFVEAIGFARTARRPRGQSTDEALYGRSRRGP